MKQATLLIPLEESRTSIIKKEDSYVSAFPPVQVKAGKLIEECKDHAIEKEVIMKSNGKVKANTSSFNPLSEIKKPDFKEKEEIKTQSPCQNTLPIEKAKPNITEIIQESGKSTRKKESSGLFESKSHPPVPIPINDINSPSKKVEPIKIKKEGIIDPLKLIRMKTEQMAKQEIEELIKPKKEESNIFDDEPIKPKIDVLW